MMKFDFELPEEDCKDWWLAENYGPCLPVSFGDMIKRYKEEGKFIPITIAAFI